MKQFIHWLTQRRFILAFLAGLMLATAFPRIGLAGLAWLVPGLWLLIALEASGQQAWRLGYVAGLAHALASLHWLLYIPVTLAPIAGWLALSAYLALYPASWAWLCWSLAPGGAGENRWVQIARSGWLQRAGWTLACAMGWVALEMVQARLLTGFPWNLLGVSQYPLLPLIQAASFAGVYGVSFVVAWFSVSLTMAGWRLVQQPQPRIAWLSDLLAPMGLVICLWIWGTGQVWHHLQTAPKAALRLALVQPSIPQTLIWDPKANAIRFDKLLQLSELALGTKPGLLVWPEAAIPELLRYHEPTFAAVTGLCRRRQVWLITGADDAQPRTSPPREDAMDYFNGSFLISPEGNVISHYYKRHLVIFGEYVPLARWLPFLKHFTPVGDSGFSPGNRPVAFEFSVAPETPAPPEAGRGDQPGGAAERGRSGADRALAGGRAGGSPAPEPIRVKTSVLICFEDILPHLAREHVQDDLDFLLNLTNDGWFRQSAAQWQHAANAVFRAVENGLPLVRCANNGLTCWVDAAGGMHEVYFDDAPDIYGQGFKTARVPLLAGAKRNATFYRRHGDLFGWTCVGGCAALMAFTWAQARRRQKAVV